MQALLMKLWHFTGLAKVKAAQAHIWGLLEKGAHTSPFWPTGG